MSIRPNQNLLLFDNKNVCFPVNLLPSKQSIQAQGNLLRVYVDTHVYEYMHALTQHSQLDSPR